ncbi:uncharacterized protein PSFLO_04998 [Pseudozyma flocculosa]|uniref:C3H1-type domain-containing protein n=1 Tax=Pseudozyma flocculosa TaxID=84751 RepID=A0A5C3F735_9BASI|nr:uncharacterized protein PSFLO_04998 [Pseudozyma flocculosa]
MAGLGQPVRALGRELLPLYSSGHADDQANQHADPRSRFSPSAEHDVLDQLKQQPMDPNLPGSMSTIFEQQEATNAWYRDWRPTAVDADSQLPPQELQALGSRDRSRDFVLDERSVPRGMTREGLPTQPPAVDSEAEKLPKGREDSWQQQRASRPWSAPGWGLNERDHLWLEQAASPSHPAHQRPFDRADATFGGRRLLSTATSESLALRSLEHVSAGHSFSTLFSGLHLDDPNALVPAGNGGASTHVLNQAGLFRAPYGPSPNNKKVDLYKTELCRQWEEKGWCDYKERCQFAHGPLELRPIQRHPLYKTQVCKAFVETGHCQYGRRCTFRHDLSPSTHPQHASPEHDKPLLARLGRASEPTPSGAYMRDGGNSRKSSISIGSTSSSSRLSSTLTAPTTAGAAVAGSLGSASAADVYSRRTSVSSASRGGGGGGGGGGAGRTDEVDAKR